MSPSYDAARSSERVARFYAGIGSRKTPDYVLDLMEQLATELRRDGYWLRSGHASGADQAFERGAQGHAQIFLPWGTFNNETPVWGEKHGHPTQAAHDIAKKYHPRWSKLTRGSRSMHARNVHQVLGYSCNSPVDFVICWAEPDVDPGYVKGGTGQAVRIAIEQKIPVFNLYNEDDYDRAFEWAWGEDAV